MMKLYFKSYMVCYNFDTAIHRKIVNSNHEEITYEVNSKRFIDGV